MQVTLNSGKTDSEVYAHEKQDFRNKCGNRNIAGAQFIIFHILILCWLSENNF